MGKKFRDIVPPVIRHRVLLKAKKGCPLCGLDRDVARQERLTEEAQYTLQNIIGNAPKFSPNFIRFKLPWPPSNNVYWRHTKTGKHYIDKPGVDFRNNVYAIALSNPGGRLKAPPGPLGIHVIIHPPDERERDADNIWKGFLDSLVAAQIIRGDGRSVLAYESAEWGVVGKPGSLEVFIWQRAE